MPTDASAIAIAAAAATLLGGAPLAVATEVSVAAAEVVA